MDYSDTLQNVIIALSIVLFIGFYICLYNNHYKGAFRIICFAFFISILLLCALILNEQLQNINDEGNQSKTNLGIINTYLETINPLIKMVDADGNPLYYPGITP